MAPSTSSLPAPAAAHFARAVQQHIAGHDAEATRSYRWALAADPTLAEAWNNLGTLLARSGRDDEACEHFEKAIALKASYGDALNNLGIFFAHRGDHARALHAFERAVAADGSRADWRNGLANALVEHFRFPEALESYDVAIAMDPGNAECWSNRALALRGLRRPDEAIASLRRALELRPDYVDALSNLGIILKEQKRFDEAATTLARAATLAPRNPAVWVNYASVFEMQGDYVHMRELAREALAIDDGYVEAHNLLANGALEEGDIDRAEATLLRVVAADPANRNANWNLALIWLMRGDFERGWRQYEWRKRIQSVVVDHMAYPGDEWDGSPLAGRDILLYSEQGIGDAIQFVRYAAELKSRGAARVYVECPYPIAPLLCGVDGVDGVVARGTAMPAVDLNASMMSLPGLLGTTIETIPARLPYIPAEPRPVASLITAEPGVRTVGIVWAGSTAHARDFLRSISLDALRPLFDIPGTRFFSLQKGEGAESQLRALPEGLVTDLAPHIDDFRDTAAAIEALDLVISVDTSVAHLAGALGRPTWLLLPRVPDFRWMLDRDDSPWYPTMRLFRQSAPRHWATVVEAVGDALRASLEEGPGNNANAADVEQRRPLDDVVTLASATRVPDGRPRFDLWFPLARLADPDAFASYEAELVGRVHDEPARRFLDEVLRADDVFVDTDPGLGLTLLTAATSPGGARTMRIVAADGAEAQRLVQIVTRRVPRAEVTSHADAAHAIAAPRTVGGDGRLIVRAGMATEGAALADAVGSLLPAQRPDAILWSDAGRAALAGCVPFLESLGYVHAALSVRDGELSLDALGGDATACVVSMTEAFFATLAEPAPASPIPAAPDARSAIGIDWELRADTGWGIYGTNLAAALARRGDVAPALFCADTRDLAPVALRVLADALRQCGARAEVMNRSPEHAVDFDGVMLRALANNVIPGPLWSRVRARRNVGVIFFEDTALDGDAIERARAFDLIVTGSHWNERLLRARGIEHVTTVLQGIDPTIFHPAPRSGLLADRFVIFSGGKLEYRKGQDIVIAAFRAFQRRHPEALLVVAWHNSWPQLVTDLALAGHVGSDPAVRDGTLALGDWLTDNGVAPHSVIDVGRLPNAMMGQVVREADVALFPNRCEGGTNLVAMECMAAGVPTIVSANTGHLDLVATDGCIALQRQRPVAPPTRFFRGVEGWGESDVDEIVETLERVYGDRTAAAAIAQRGAEVMARMSWRTQAELFVQAIRPLLA